MIRTDVFGWFDDPAATKPAHDPGIATGKCAACGQGLQLPVKTISLMPEGGSRSYFFRAHKDCWENLDVAERAEIEGALIDATVLPLYSHDCDRCVYLGRFDDPDDGSCDLYACQCACSCQEINLIARTSDDHDRCWPASFSHEVPESIREAKRRAQTQRLFGLETGEQSPDGEC
jgi:hypothetical protein